MTKQELEVAVETFGRALAQLKEVFGETAQHDVLRDAAIQRFEFTYELCWKAMKVYFDYEGFQCASPRECFKKAFQKGLIEATDEQIFLDMIRDRNLSTHTYSEKQAEFIFKAIQERYSGAFEGVFSRLAQKTA